MATIRDVAKMAGVSISTVSLAFNDSGPVSPETRKRIWDAAKTVGYVPNPLAQSLKRGHSHLVGMVLGDVSNPFFGRLLKEVEKLALDQQYLVIVSDTDTDPDRELAILEHLTAQRVAGIILSPHGHGSDYVDKLRRIDTPIVMIDHRIPGVQSDFVASDNVLASAMLTEHVVRLGHKRIAHLSGRVGLWTAEQRLTGFHDTMNAAGIEVDPGLVVDGDYQGERAYEQTMRLLTRAKRPTAILAANNVMALGALQAMNDLGVSCPDEISLASIDDVPWGEVIQPRITMVVQPIHEIARIATEFLLERIKKRNGPAIAARERILVPKLVVGHSCAPLKKAG